MILRLLPCGVTWVLLTKSSVTCVCCNTQCIAQVFGECALNGGTSRSPTGGNTCRKKHGTPRASVEPSGTANYDRGLRPQFASAGIRSCVAQPVARVRAAYQLDRTCGRCDFKKSPRADCRADSRIHHLDFRMANVRIWAARI